MKKCYGAIVSALETIYQESHEPEALGISKILSKPSTLFSIYLLDYILPEVSKLSKSLQTEKLDLSITSSLVNATLHTLEDVLQPAAKWVLDLQEVKEEMDITVGINFNSDDVASFQSWVTEPFYTILKENIANRFVSQDVVSCFSIFDPKKTPNSLENCTYGDNQVKVLLEYYGSELPAETVVGDEFLMPAVITSSSDLHTEWKTFRRYITNQPREDIKEQLKEVSTNSMMQTMFPNLSILANVWLTIPVGTASVECSFSHMKMVKSRLRNRLGEANLSYLIKIALESPEALSDEELEQIVTVWTRKPRRIAVWQTIYKCWLRLIS